MATLDQLSYNLLNKARGGLLSDDESINLKQVKFWIHNTRALLIRQDIQKGRSISGNIIQGIHCLGVEQVDASLCPCIISTGCIVLRTKKRIPKPIEIDTKDLIISVKPIKINSRSFTLINLARAPWIGFNKYSKNNPKAFYYDGYIWILMSDNPIEKINVFGVWEDPTALKEFVNCSNEPCYSDNQEYPLSNWMIKSMDQLITEQDFRMILQTNIDEKGNAKPDVSPMTNKE